MATTMNADVLDISQFSHTPYYWYTSLSNKSMCVYIYTHIFTYQHNCSDDVCENFQNYYAEPNL